MRNKMVFLVLIGALAISCSSSRPVPVAHPQARTIGVPVKSVNWVRLHLGLSAAGEPRVYATMGQQADDLFLLQIDPVTGAVRQFVAGVPKANYPTATLMSRSGVLYIGSSYAGHLLKFDPKKDVLEDCGAINPEKATFPCAIDEDARGIIWIGSYPTADLTSFDPKSGEFHRYGRLDDVEMYAYPMVGADGRVYSRIMQTAPKCVVLDPRTGKKAVVGPTAVKGKDTFELRKDAKGNVHIVSSLGHFRLDGFQAVPEKDAAVTPTPLPFYGIQAVQFLDTENESYLKLSVQPEKGEARVLSLDYHMAGTEIFYIQTGPDGLIYGSSLLPLHLFRCNPATGELADLGKASTGTGEAYSMANLGGKLYISAYPGAALSVYDPAKPCKFGDLPDSNPRDLGRMDTLSYRPRSTLAGPGGKVWTASLPDYGRWGGPLSWYDPSTGQKKAYYGIVGDGSCYTLADLGKAGLIAVGTSINGGSGTLPKVDQAVLFLWDTQNEKKAWEGTMDRKVESFNALLALPNGKVLGTVTGGGQPELFLFDPASKKFEKRADPPAGAPLDLGLQLGPDGAVYGFTKSCLYRLDPATLAVTEILREEEGFDVPGPILGGDVYYAKNMELKAVRLFETPKK